MNFFEQQDLARRNTLRLVVLLVLAVLSLIAITCIFIAVFFYYFVGNNPALAYDTSGSMLVNIWRSLSLQTVAGIAAVIVAVVLLGSLFKYAQLRGGGRTVAAAMGGRLINQQTQDADERKILNVVEEMAIASGTAVPPVYVMEEQGINAFAAGFHPQDAVIGITRGSIKQLSRDELQGVVAHEFSHIFHGDMRLNMRLVAILHGILLIGLIGEFLLRSTSRTRYVATSSNRKDSRGGIMLLGLGLFVIGYTGTFFGNLIKAAVSRQREYLADASAVQFTRNPEGIAGALKKIGGAVLGSQLEQKNAAEFSHMYFSQGVKSLVNLLATHPPLEQRIRRIQPRWDGKFIAGATAGNSASRHSNAGQMAFSNEHNQASSPLASQLSLIAQPNQQHLAYAREHLAQIPAAIKDASHEPYSARALVFALLLDKRHAEQQRQWQLLHNHYSAEHLLSLRTLVDSTLQLPVRLRLPLVELCLPSLQQLSSTQRNDFLLALKTLINADGKVSLAEWSLYRIVQHHLELRPQAQRLRNLRELRSECQLILSLLAHASRDETPQAFHRAATALHMQQLALLPVSSLQLAALDAALEQLNLVKPLQKPQLLKAMAACVHQDQQLNDTEAELFRAIAESLDCPLPPFLNAERPM